MFDSRSRVIRMISFCGVLVSIQGQPHRLISDRMRKNLQAPAIKFCHGLCVLRGIPKQLASLTWVVTVRREHGCGVRPREPKLIGFMDSQTQSREPLFATGFWHDLGN